MGHMAQWKALAHMKNCSFKEDCSAALAPPQPQLHSIIYGSRFHGAVVKRPKRVTGMAERGGRGGEGEGGGETPDVS